MSAVKTFYVDASAFTAKSKNQVASWILPNRYASSSFDSGLLFDCCRVVSYPEYEDSWKSVACCAWLHFHNVLTKGVQH